MLSPIVVRLVSVASKVPAMATASQMTGSTVHTTGGRPSAVSFTIGALLPLIAILAPPPGWRIPVTFVAVLAALALTGDISARLGRASRRTAITRLVVGGGLALLVTYGIGRLVGAAVT